MQTADVIAVTTVGLSGLAYVLMVAVFVGAVSRRRRRRPEREPDPVRVSILKPLAGRDDDLLDNLRSFGRLEGVEHEVLLGVASTNDPALETARELLRLHPDLDARIVLTDPDAALNPKVAQLIGLERAATGDVLVVSDSNARVRPDYLRHLVGELQQPGVGLVSSCIAGTGERTLGAALENVVLGTYVTPGVVAGYVLSGRAITIGKSMAMWRGDLRELGGFEEMASVLAEDHALARRFHAHGLAVRLCTEPIENRNVGCSVRRSLERHARWAKIRRAMAPHGYALEPLAMPLVPAAVALAAAPSTLTAGLLLGAGVLQTIGGQLCLRALRGRGVGPWRALLVPLASAVVVHTWLVGWASRTVCWRGHKLRVGAHTHLEPATAGPVARMLAYVLG